MLAAVKSSKEEQVRALVSELSGSSLREDDRPPLTLAFVGQYNAGKSTLIKALTGRVEIPIDSDVCTNQIVAYDWEGIRLIDTPGVHAGLPTHDDLTENQIAKSDLLIFVITAELFGDDIALYFRELAFARRRASELMLVVNKMDQDPGTPEVKRADIEIVTSPLSMEDFRTVFVSGELFLDSLDEVDTEAKKALIQESGIGELIEALDAFCQEQGVLGALTTPLFTIRSVATEAAGICSTDQPEERAALELLGRRARILRESRPRLSACVHGLLNRTLTDIAAIGDAAAGGIEPGKTNEEIKRAMSHAEKVARERVERLKEEVAGAIGKEKETLAGELKRLAEGMLAAKLRSFTERGASSPKPDPEATFAGQTPTERADSAFAARMSKMSNVAQSIGDWMVQITKGTKVASGWGPSAAAGSQAHKVIYDVGKFFGYSFEPWEAAGMAAKIGKIGKVLGPVAAILQVVGQILEEKMEERERIQFQKARSDTRAVFWDSANAVRHVFATHFDAFLNDFYGPLMTETEELMDDMQGAKSKRQSEKKSFQDISAEALVLIEEIQAADVEATPTGS